MARDLTSDRILTPCKQQNHLETTTVKCKCFPKQLTIFTLKFAIKKQVRVSRLAEIVFERHNEAPG